MIPVNSQAHSVWVQRQKLALRRWKMDNKKWIDVPFDEWNLLYIVLGRCFAGVIVRDNVILREAG